MSAPGLTARHIQDGQQGGNLCSSTCSCAVRMECLAWLHSPVTGCSMGRSRTLDESQGKRGGSLAGSSQLDFQLASSSCKSVSPTTMFLLWPIFGQSCPGPCGCPRPGPEYWWPL